MLLVKKALLSAFFIASVSSGAATAQCQPEGESFAVEIERVVDGDTVRLGNGRSLRILGINTPELNLGKGIPEPLAELASAELKRLATAAQARLVLGQEPEDRYKRLLGHLLLDGVNAAEYLLSQGFGWAVVVEPNTGQADCLFAAESVARAKGIGVWKYPIARAASLRKGGFALVRGAVTHIDTTAKYIYIELDDHLALRLLRKQLSSAEVARVNSSVGRLIEARGWVIDRRKQVRSGSGFKPYLLPITSAWHWHMPD